MNISITLTKVIIPRRRFHLLTRQRLLDSLIDLLDHRLTLIAAPAGYGKTSLLIDLAASVEYPVCWFALDPLDKNIYRFIAHFIASIQHRFPDFGGSSSAVLQSAGQSDLNLDHLAATIVNDVYQHVTEHFAIVLDDYHLIEESEDVNHFINRFGQEMDENCHLVIASRSLLSLPDLPLMVGRSQVKGLSFEELVFRPKEIQALLQRNYNQLVSEEEASSLARETEGWITGLLLSAETMRKGMIEQVRVARVYGIDVYDYLAQQVLDQQSQQVRDFLLHTSLLEEFDSQLCQSVFGQVPEGMSWSRLIEIVLHNNLFVQPVESGGTWLRYHHLFRDFLQECISKEQPKEEDRILRRLVDVYAERGEWEKAYAVCRRLGDDEITVGLIEQAITPLARAGQVKTLEAWYDALPEAALTSRPFLMALFGSIALDLGKTDKALSLLNTAETALRDEGDPILLARTLTWKANAYLYLGDYLISLVIVEEALDLAKYEKKLNIVHADALRVKGDTLNRLGRANESISCLTHSLDLYTTLGDEVNVAIVQLSLGLVYMNTGRQSQALNYYQSALNQWREANDLTKQATLLNNMGVSYHFSGDLAQARICFGEALDLARQSGLPRAEAFILTSLGDLYVDFGFFDAARDHYWQARQIAQRLEVRYLLLYLVLAEVRIMRRSGELARAQQTLSATEEAVREGHSGYEEAFWSLEKGCLLVASNETTAAIPWLINAARDLTSGGQPIEAAQAYLYLAMAHYMLGEKTAAMTIVAQAAQAASRLERIYPLVAVGSDVKDMLKDFEQEPGAGDFARQLLDQIEEFDQERPRLRRLIREQDDQASLSPPELNIRAFGETLVELNGKPVTRPEWANQRKVRELFFLLLENPGGLTKEAIADDLWPGGELHQLPKQFNNAIYRLRRALGKETVSFDQENGRYRFNWGMDYRYDVKSFQAKLEQARSVKDLHVQIAAIKEAIELYRGTYLPDVEGVWAEPIRERLRRIYIEAVLVVAQFYFQNADYEETLGYCGRIFLEEPCQEAAHRLAMRVHVASGNRPEAARQYERCKLALQLYLGLLPSTETESLFEQLVGNNRL